MVRKSKIGVVILNYRDAATTERLCRKISSYDVIDHIVIVDNQSPDDSYEVLAKLCSAKVDVIQSDKNGGYSYGNNVGANFLIDEYQIDVLYIANPDVEFEELFIEKTTEVIVSGRAEAAGGVMLMTDGKPGIDGTRINGYVDDLLDCTLLLKHLIGKKQKPVNPGTEIVNTEFLYGSLFGIDARVFCEIGGFDESVFLYCEERILGRKLKDRGFRLAIDTSVSYLHRHAVSVERSIKRVEQIRILYQSRKYYYQNYVRLSKFRQWILDVAMGYGILVRRLVNLFV